uniref:Peptidase S1 domain-containing protein n=1 Tax=Anopheles christyi TaxID=43041 RepID=A0A182JQT7_9DIPT
MKRLAFIIIPAIIALGHSIRPPIIEGTEANLHEFPYQVSIQWNFNNGSRARHFCSGSIINQRWILTAAHCLEEVDTKGWFEVVAGVNNIADEESGAQRRNVTRYEQHKLYDLQAIKYDIGVLLLSQPLDLNRNIKTMRLATKDTLFSQQIAKFAGWGSISKTWNDIYPDKLMKVSLILRTQEDCQAVGKVDETQLCAGGYKNVSGCTADSGGPLTVNIDDEQVQIGVLSYGEKPCQARLPVVFSSVMYFHDWIQGIKMARVLRVAVLVTLAALVAAKPSRPKIVGGEVAIAHEFPYQISLQWNFNDNEQDPFHFCGGSLIAERFVLTAAHCVPSAISPDGFPEAVAGEHDLSQFDAAVQRRRIVEMYVHEDYEGGVGPNDIAIFRVDKPFHLNRKVQLVRLPEPNAIPTGVCTISGWGSTSFTSMPSYPDLLMKTTLPIMDLEDCRAIYITQEVADSNICAGTMEGSSSVCSGDSGGPLVQTDDQIVQVGIVSWGGIPCGGYRNPGVFVRVSYFIDWINDKINN